MIPIYDHNMVLPPYIGSPTNLNDISPYACTIMELCQKFASSVERKQILVNFINFRKEIRANGMASNAFQWIDGSFVENIEQSEQRPPNDIDVITFYHGYDDTFQVNLMAALPEFGDSQLAKAKWQVDHYAVQIDYDDYLFTFDMVRYWSLLFTHNRNGIWKGILMLQLDTAQDDDDAIVYINSL